MNFKSLPIEELEKLEKEFIFFLVSNGIEANEWTKIKKNNPKRVEQLIVEFSKIVYDSGLEKLEFIHKHESDCLQAMHVYSGEFTEFECILDSKTEHIINVENLSSNHFLFPIEKREGTFDSSRKNFFYKKLMEEKYQISDGSWYKKLALLWAEQDSNII